MKNRIFRLQRLVGILLLASSGAAFAQMDGALKDRIFSDAKALGLPDTFKEAPAVEVPLPVAAALVLRPAHRILPENCSNMPVMYTRNGDLYKNGQKLGSNVSSYKAACSGDVAWRDGYGAIYKNETNLGDSSRNFEIALYTGDVFWRNSYGRLYKDSSEIGNARTFAVADHTGDIAWRDNYGRLYKNGIELGNSNRYQIVGHTGDVVWVNNYGILCKNQEELGNSSRFAVAERTGDVAWKDSYSRLYLNKTQIASNCRSFELREDGKLLWRDMSGEYHYYQ